ncbi:MAG: bifunctional ADP-dependent NAD(P)H-hydrate dehydratase/NAD(P)H-hydrate epimerase [Nocardioidaceae bacterium]
MDDQSARDGRAYSVESIRAAEATLMAHVPEGALMASAAAALANACADVLWQLRGGVYGTCVLLMVGAGDNGGDALYAGALLARRGVRVEIVLLSPDKTHAAGLAQARAEGARVVGAVGRADLVVDGIVGIGGRGGLRRRAWEIVSEVNRRGIPVLAVDAPSGIDLAGGPTPAEHVTATATVTFGALKTGLVVGPGADAAGPVHVVDIGLRPHLPDHGEVEVFGQPQAVDVLSAVVPAPMEHKYTRGVVGLATGSAAYSGAGLLSVAGASCGIAGMVRYTGDDAVTDLIRSAHPEVVFGAGRVQAWVVGCGSGDGAQAALDLAVQDGVPVVVDADALACVTGPLGVPALLTPHAGELARILGLHRDDVESDPLRHAREAAARFEASVLLKGDRTVVAGPGGVVPLVNITGPPWLATAGSGDVLAGLAGALMARLGGDHPAHVVGALAAWLHGSAGILASRGGPITAPDVAAALPAAVREALGSAPTFPSPPSASSQLGESG